MKKFFLFLFFLIFILSIVNLFINKRIDYEKEMIGEFLPEEVPLYVNFNYRAISDFLKSEKYKDICNNIINFYTGLPVKDNQIDKIDNILKYTLNDNCCAAFVDIPYSSIKKAPLIIVSRSAVDENILEKALKDTFDNIEYKNEYYKQYRLFTVLFENSSAYYIIGENFFLLSFFSKSAVKKAVDIYLDSENKKFSNNEKVNTIRNAYPESKIFFYFNSDFSNCLIESLIDRIKEADIENIYRTGILGLDSLSYGFLTANFNEDILSLKGKLLFDKNGPGGFFSFIKNNSKKTDFIRQLPKRGSYISLGFTLNDVIKLKNTIISLVSLVSKRINERCVEIEKDFFKKTGRKIDDFLSETFDNEIHVFIPVKEDKLLFKSSTLNFKLKNSDSNNDTCIGYLIGAISDNKNVEKKMSGETNTFEITNLLINVRKKIYTNKYLREFLKLKEVNSDYSFIDKQKIILSYSKIKDWFIIGSENFEDILGLFSKKDNMEIVDNEFSSFLDKSEIYGPNVFQGIVNINTPVFFKKNIPCCFLFNLVNRETYFDYNASFKIKDSSEKETEFSFIGISTDRYMQILESQLTMINTAIRLYKYDNDDKSIPASLNELKGSYIGAIPLNPGHGTYIYKKIDKENYLLAVTDAKDNIKHIFVSQFNKLYHLDRMFEDEKKYLLDYFNRY